MTKTNLLKCRVLSQNLCFWWRRCIMQSSLQFISCVSSFTPWRFYVRSVSLLAFHYFYGRPFINRWQWFTFHFSDVSSFLHAHFLSCIFKCLLPLPPHSVQGFPLLAATAPFFFSLRNVTRVALDVIKVWNSANSYSFWSQLNIMNMQKCKEC